MTSMELESLVRHEESDTVKFEKSTCPLKCVTATLCAFLNGHSGLVFELARLTRRTPATARVPRAHAPAPGR